ncbi:unnamed protein product [Amoebophrya sp. A120]|nr:unnamed protein product [Amoebophrya sp. A120]|eukprot:GSA120T00024354001.1
MPTYPYQTTAPRASGHSRASSRAPSPSMLPGFKPPPLGTIIAPPGLVPIPSKFIASPFERRGSNTSFDPNVRRHSNDPISKSHSEVIVGTGPACSSSANLAILGAGGALVGTSTSQTYLRPTTRNAMSAKASPTGLQPVFPVPSSSVSTKPGLPQEYHGNKAASPEQENFSQSQSAGEFYFYQKSKSNPVNARPRPRNQPFHSFPAHENSTSARSPSTSTYEQLWIASRAQSREVLQQPTDHVVHGNKMQRAYQIQQEQHHVAVEEPQAARVQQHPRVVPSSHSGRSPNELQQHLPLPQTVTSSDFVPQSCNHVQRGRSREQASKNSYQHIACSPGGGVVEPVGATGAMNSDANNNFEDVYPPMEKKESKQADNPKSHQISHGNNRSRSNSSNFNPNQNFGLAIPQMLLPGSSVLAPAGGLKTSGRRNNSPQDNNFGVYNYGGGAGAGAGDHDYNNINVGPGAAFDIIDDIADASDPTVPRMLSHQMNYDYRSSNRANNHKNSSKSNSNSFTEFSLTERSIKEWEKIVKYRETDLVKRKESVMESRAILEDRLMLRERILNDCQKVARNGYTHEKQIQNLVLETQALANEIHRVETERGEKEKRFEEKEMAELRQEKRTWIQEHVEKLEKSNEELKSELAKEKETFEQTGLSWKQKFKESKKELDQSLKEKQTQLKQLQKELEKQEFDTKLKKDEVLYLQRKNGDRKVALDEARGILEEQIFVARSAMSRHVKRDYARAETEEQKAVEVKSSTSLGEKKLEEDLHTFESAKVRRNEQAEQMDEELLRLSQREEVLFALRSEILDLIRVINIDDLPPWKLNAMSRSRNATPRNSQNLTSSVQSAVFGLMGSNMGSIHNPQADDTTLDEAAKFLEKIQNIHDEEAAAVYRDYRVFCRRAEFEFRFFVCESRTCGVASDCELCSVSSCVSVSCVTTTTTISKPSKHFRELCVSSVAARDRIPADVEVSHAGRISGSCAAVLRARNRLSEKYGSEAEQIGAQCELLPDDSDMVSWVSVNSDVEEDEEGDDCEGNCPGEDHGKETEVVVEAQAVVVETSTSRAGDDFYDQNGASSRNVNQIHIAEHEIEVEVEPEVDVDGKQQQGAIVEVDQDLHQEEVQPSPIHDGPDDFSFGQKHSARTDVAGEVLSTEREDEQENENVKRINVITVPASAVAASMQHGQMNVLQSSIGTTSSNATTLLTATALAANLNMVTPRFVSPGKRGATQVDSKASSEAAYFGVSEGTPDTLNLSMTPNFVGNSAVTVEETSTNGATQPVTGPQQIVHSASAKSIMQHGPAGPLEQAPPLTAPQPQQPAQVPMAPERSRFVGHHSSTPSAGAGPAATTAPTTNSSSRQRSRSTSRDFAEWCASKDFAKAVVAPTILLGPGIGSSTVSYGASFGAATPTGAVISASTSAVPAAAAAGPASRSASAEMMVRTNVTRTSSETVTPTGATTMAASNSGFFKKTIMPTPQQQPQLYAKVIKTQRPLVEHHA